VHDAPIVVARRAGGGEGRDHRQTEERPGEGTEVGTTFMNKKDPDETMRQIRSEQRERLRDRFAMAALTGLPTTEQTPEHLAKTAYRIADAMLAEREKTPCSSPS